MLSLPHEPRSTQTTPQPVDVEMLFRLYNARLVSYLVNRLPNRNRALAEDLAQDAWLHMTRYTPKQGTTRTEFGLVAIQGRNAIGRYYRHLNTGHLERPASYDEWSEKVEAAPAAAPPADLPAFYRALLDALPEEERAVLTLRCEGVPFAGVGSHLGTAECTARKRANAAAAKLRPIVLAR